MVFGGERRSGDAMINGKESYSSKRVPFITIEWPGDQVSDKEPLRAILYSTNGTAAFTFEGDQAASDSWSDTALVRFLHNFAEALCQYQREAFEREMGQISNTSH
jgi:hypothetical protein